MSHKAVLYSENLVAQSPQTLLKPFSLYCFSLSVEDDTSYIAKNADEAQNLFLVSAHLRMPEYSLNMATRPR